MPRPWARVRPALNSGKEVITHTDPISVPGWQGAGYVITDMDTGAGVWKIGGGLNGGLLDLLDNAQELFWSILDELGGAAGKIAATLKMLVDHIRNLIDVIANCPTTIAIIGIISITLVLIGFLLLAPAFAALGTAAAIGYGVFSGLSVTAVSTGWINSCKK